MLTEVTILQPGIDLLMEDMPEWIREQVSVEDETADPVPPVQTNSANVVYGRVNEVQQAEEMRQRGSIMWFREEMCSRLRLAVEMGGRDGYERVRSVLFDLLSRKDVGDFSDALDVYRSDFEVIRTVMDVLRGL